MNNKNNSDYLKGWDTKEHLDNFNIWNSYSNMYFNFVFGSFFENKFLLHLIKKKNQILL